VRFADILLHKVDRNHVIALGSNGTRLSPTFIKVNSFVVEMNANTHTKHGDVSPDCFYLFRKESRLIIHDLVYPEIGNVISTCSLFGR
jgi:hypothetical protein